LIKRREKEGKMRKEKRRKKLRTEKIRHEENVRKARTMHSKNEGEQTKRKQEKGRIWAKCNFGRTFRIRNNFNIKVRN